VAVQIHGSVEFVIVIHGFDERSQGDVALPLSLSLSHTHTLSPLNIVAALVHGLNKLSMYKICLHTYI